MAARAKRRRTRRKKTRPPVKFSKVAVTALLVSVAAFTVTMIIVYIHTGGVPDTLVASFFAFAGGEAGFLGLIKHSDTKYGSDASDTTTNANTDGGSDNAVG